MREMKNSGVAWIGDIPSEWELKKGKFLFAQRNEKGNTIELQLLSPTQKYGVIPQSLYEELSGMKAVKLSEDANLTDFKSIYTGDFCISLRSFQGGFEYALYNGVVSPAYQVFYKITKNTFDGFYKYMFKEQGFIAYMTSFTKTFRDGKSISFSDFANSLLPLPPFAEQKRIAEFLDNQCAEIDAAIEKTKATIEEYKKLKQSVITQAVTKGIRPNRPMKDSGIEWIGEIPAEWNMVKITRLLDYNVSYPIGDGDHGLISPSDYLDVGVPYLRVQNLGFGTPINDNGLVYISEETNEKIKGSILRPNDVLFAKTGATIGKTGIIPSNMPIANTTSHIGKITVSPDYNPMWILYTLSSNVGYRQFWEIAIQKTTRPELSIAEIKSIRLPMPKSSLEQEIIVNYLDKKCSEIDELIAKKTSLLSELESYKKSLIYEYVTGKKEV